MHIFLENGPRFSRNSDIASLLLLTWFFPVVTLTTVNYQDTGEYVIYHSNYKEAKECLDYWQPCWIQCT